MWPDMEIVFVTECEIYNFVCEVSVLLIADCAERR